MTAAERQAIADIIRAELTTIKSDVAYLRGCNDTGKNTVKMLVKTVILPLILIVAAALGVNLTPMIAGGA
jgi:hypothetical protein